MFGWKNGMVLIGAVAGFCCSVCFILLNKSAVDGAEIVFVCWKYVDGFELIVVCGCCCCCCCWKYDVVDWLTGAVTGWLTGVVFKSFDICGANADVVKDWELIVCCLRTVGAGNVENIWAVLEVGIELEKLIWLLLNWCCCCTKEDKSAVLLFLLLALLLTAPEPVVSSDDLNDCAIRLEPFCGEFNCELPLPLVIKTFFGIVKNAWLGVDALLFCCEGEGNIGLLGLSTRLSDGGLANAWLSSLLGLELVIRSLVDGCGNDDKIFGGFIRLIFLGGKNIDCDGGGGVNIELLTIFGDVCILLLLVLLLTVSMLFFSFLFFKLMNSI